MSKFNTTQTKPSVFSGPIVAGATPTGRTYEGAPGYAHDTKSELFLLAVTNMVGEDTFYEPSRGRDSRYAQLVQTMAVADLDWTGRFLGWLRSAANMRSASLVGALEAARALLAAGLGQGDGDAAQGRRGVRRRAGRSRPGVDLVGFATRTFRHPVTKGASVLREVDRAVRVQPRRLPAHRLRRGRPEPDRARRPDRRDVPHDPADRGGEERQLAVLGPAGGWGTGLASGAPVRHPVPLFDLRDGGHATAAGLGAAPVHVRGLPFVERAGRALRPAAPVRGEQQVGEPHQRLQILHFGHSGPGGEAAQVQDLALVQVADAGEVGLVEERLGDRGRRVGGDAAYRLGRVPVRTEEVGSEVPDAGVLLVGRYQREVVHVVPDRRDTGRAQHHPDQVGRTGGPSLAGAEDPPLPVHAQVRVQGEPAVAAGCGQAEQQMLAAAGRLRDRPAGKVHSGQCRYPEVAVLDGRAGQRAVQRLRGVPDGVAFGHRSTVSVADTQHVAGRDRQRHHGPAAVDGHGHPGGRVDVHDELPGRTFAEGRRVHGPHAADGQRRAEAVQRLGWGGELDVAEAVHGEHLGLDPAVAGDDDWVGQAYQRLGVHNGPGVVETLPECQAGGDRREDVPAVERGGDLWGEPLVVGQLDRPQHAA